VRYRGSASIEAAQRVGWAAEGKGKSLLRKGPKWLPILISG